MMHRNADEWKSEAERLREALERIVHIGDALDLWNDEDARSQMCELARSALEARGER